MAPITPIRSVADTIVAPSLEPKASDSFADYLKQSVGEVEKLGQTAAQSAERFLNGEGEELHQVALSMQKAELAFELMMQVRNKAVAAYQEVMRMQL
jgi:flagellar hook-basal body complex protein FliE